MVNLYQLLGISFQSSNEEIKAAIAMHYAENTLPENILRKAKEWLLNPEIRAKYDGKLKLAYPNYFKAEVTEEYRNLYEFLGIKPTNKVRVIQQAIEMARQDGKDRKTILLCKNYLLNKQRKRVYDLSIKQSWLEKMRPLFQKATSTPKNILISIVIVATAIVSLAYLIQAMERHWDIFEAKLAIENNLTSGGAYPNKIDFKMVYQPDNDTDFVCGYVSQPNAYNRISYRRFIYPKLNQTVQFEENQVSDNGKVFEKAWKVICMEEKYELYFPNLQEQYYLINKLDTEARELNSHYSSHSLDKAFYVSRLEQIGMRKEALIQMVNEQILVTKFYPGIDY